MIYFSLFMCVGRGIYFLPIPVMNCADLRLQGGQLQGGSPAHSAALPLRQPGCFSSTQRSLPPPDSRWKPLDHFTVTLLSHRPLAAFPPHGWSRLRRIRRATRAGAAPSPLRRSRSHRAAWRLCPAESARRRPGERAAPAPAKVGAAVGEWVRGPRESV